MISESKLKLISESGVLDTVVTYQLVKLIGLPFAKWKACEAGIIDDKGVLLREPTDEERNTIWRRFEILIRNIKVIITKFTGHSQLSAALVALYLFKEGKPKIQEYTEDFDSLANILLELSFDKSTLNNSMNVTLSECNANYNLIQKDIIL